MATNNRAIERVLHAIDGGLITRGDDFVYRNRRRQDMDDAVYLAEQNGWVRLLTDGHPEVTTEGRQWIATRPRRSERAPTVPVFACPGGGQVAEVAR